MSNWFLCFCRSVWGKHLGDWTAGDFACKVSVTTVTEHQLFCAYLHSQSSRVLWTERLTMTRWIKLLAYIAADDFVDGSSSPASSLHVA